MKLVVDANILFSALIKDSVARRLLFEEEFELYAPEYLFEEFAAHNDEILLKSKRSEGEFWQVIAILRTRITIIPFQAFEKFMEQAQKVSPDKDDAAYFAVALAVGGSIWSNDKALKHQKAVQVLNIQELLAKKG